MKKVLVIGLGVSGRSAVQFLLNRGYEVHGYDRNTPQSEPASLEFSFAVVSPGVSPSDPIYKRVVESGLEVISEVELALRDLKERAIAVTGTNGKTTVTLLVEHVLCSAGLPAKAVGNVGVPITSYVPKKGEILVVELSSYQLETMHTPIFEAGVILNITPDHLDRYDSMQAYAQAKCRLQGLVKGELIIHHSVAREYGLKNVVVYGEDLKTHDEENNEAAFLLVSRFGVSREQFEASLASFVKPPHRIEVVASIGGVTYVDDSKGTNIDAVIRAVEAMQGPVVLIAGGVDKGASYRSWILSFGKKVKKIYTMGQAAKKMQEELADDFSVEIVSSLEAAVEKSSKYAIKGDTVLLSPGCSSFDMFRDYAHRGEEFRRNVIKLMENHV